MLDAVHTRHLENLCSLDAVVTYEGLRLGTQYVMFFAEAELMRLHAQRLVEGVDAPDVLEVGLGLGIFAEQLAAVGVGTYTAIEPHPQVAGIAEKRMLRTYPAPARLITQPWQLTAFLPASFDAIMYDTWPPDGYADSDFELFVKTVAIPCLRPGGRFSFFSSGPELSQVRHQILMQHFAEVQVWPYSMEPHNVPPSWTKPSTEFVIPLAVREGGRR